DRLLEALGRVEDDRAGAAGQTGRRRERGPPVAALGDALARGRAVAADPDRWPGQRERAWVGGDAAGAEAPALEGDVVAGPDGLDHVEGLLEELVALGVVDAERGELALEVAGRRRQREAAARHEVERRPRLGDQEGVAVRQHHDV